MRWSVSMRGVFVVLVIIILVTILSFEQYNGSSSRSEMGINGYSKDVSDSRIRFTEGEVNAELNTVLSRLRECLAATNLSTYFAVNDYFSTAERNARHVLKELRKFVPRFEKSYDVPCWNTLFEVTQVLPRRSMSRAKSRTILGSIDGVHFTYNESTDAKFTMILLDHVDWDVQVGQGKMHVRRSVACLPKIFVMGYPKCGSTFLYCLLKKILSFSLNLEGICQAIKEPHWWIKMELRVQSISPGYLALYLLNFENAAKFVGKSQPAVTIDATPNLMFQWPRYSESETMENYCLIPSLVPVVLPDSKYFVVMRNPVSMMYSAFWFSCTRLHTDMSSVIYKGPVIFHERVTKKIRIFNDCRTRGNPLDKCMHVAAEDIFDPELPLCGRTRLEMGLYYVHAHKWLSVLPRERIHFFTLEELATQDLKQTGKVILDFLEIPSTDKMLREFDHFTCNENQQHVVDYKHDPRLKMRADTRQILEEFFRPFNQMLADLLGDDKFLWNH